MNITMKYLMNHEYVSIGSQSANHRIILIHGWGADVYDLLPLGESIVKMSEFDFEIICIRARNVRDENDGRQWYGLYPSDWVKASIEVQKLIETLQKFDTEKISLKKTILLGFSQGAAMSVAAGCNLDLGLIVSCSGYPHPNWKPMKNNPPIIFSHGLKDEIVPFKASRNMYRELKKISVCSCDLFEFNGYHEIDSELVNIVNKAIRQIF